MTLGTKLQSVASRVNAKLGTQDAPIVFRKTTVSADPKFGKPYSSTSNTDVTITQGAKVSRIRGREVDAAGTLRVGDLKLMVPGGLLTEAHLKDSQILYSGDTYGIVAFQPASILSGVVVEWQVIGRVEI